MGQTTGTADSLLERRVLESASLKQRKHVVSKRAYLQRVLVSKDLQAAGAGPFPNGQPNAFLRLAPAEAQAGALGRR